MGRPKCYASPAARQAAYRQRLAAEMVRVNRRALTQMEERIARLLAAMAQAAHRGDPLARQLHRAHQDTTLDNLIDWFTTRGALDAPSSAAPARSALGLGAMAAPTRGQECSVPLSATPSEHGEK